MCVLIHTARKDLLQRQELRTAMNNNRSGFFISELLPNGKRNTIRTLDMDEATQFWDKIPNQSEVVMHFRRPSRGGISLANVHGWEEDHILFGHNKTLYNLFSSIEADSWDKTDSEYFFRKIFIPLYRHFGKRAFRKGILHPVLDHVVNGICTEPNKFLFVMPDNTVLRFGTWEGDDETRPGFHASNTSYLPEPEVRKSWKDKLFHWFKK